MTVVDILQHTRNIQIGSSFDEEVEFFLVKRSNAMNVFLNGRKKVLNHHNFLKVR